MAEISAQMVKELRESTGAGMMDCKKALEEANGDMNAAVDILREQARLLEKKTNKKVKATFSKVLYSTSYEGLAILGKAVASMTAQAGSEIFEDELAEKQDMNDLYRV